MDERESICLHCFHSYVCEQFNEHRDVKNDKCHFYNDHFVPYADVAPVQKWISVKDRLPEPEQEVFVCVRSKISNYSYVCCAMHVPENWYRQSSVFCWDFECCDEYDEEQDDYIVKQGWYESIHNWDDYSVVGIDDIVTHWMPILEPPKEE